MSIKLCLPVLLLAATVGRADDVPTGPIKGEKVPALKVFDVTGAHKDKEVDYTADRGAKPTVYVLIRAEGWNRPTHRFLKTLSETAAKAPKDAYLVAVWLSDKPEDTKAYLPKIGNYYENAALTCFPIDKEGPKDWNVNSDAAVSVVVVAGAKVSATFGYRGVNETDAATIQKALDAAAGK